MKNVVTIEREKLRYQRVAHIIWEVNRVLQGCLERRLLNHGVSFGFWPYLRVLWEHEGLSQKALSDLVGLTAPTTHSVIKRMEQAGLVELKPIVEGKPRRAVHLSAKGRNLRSTLEPLAMEVNSLVVGELDDEEQAELRELLLTVYKSLLSDGSDRRTEAVPEQADE